MQDFAAVVIINLAVSLFVALFFIPSLQPGLMPSVPQEAGRKGRRFGKLNGKLKRLAVYFGRFYLALMRFMGRWRKSVCFLLVLGFGIPVFMLPEKIEMKAGKQYSHTDSVLINGYNKAMSNSTYKEKVKPVAEVALGGSLRLFVQKVYNGSYLTRREETILSVSASMPNGTTLPQMNNLIQRMESYLSTYGGSIRQFQTRILNARQARIDIFFTKESEQGGFPYTLKSRIITKALELGGGSWNVYGLPDQGFSNDVRETAGSYRVELLGYNYDELYQYAEVFRDTLLGERRIKEVFISHEFSWWRDDYREFFFNLDKQRLAAGGTLTVELFSSLQPVFGRNIAAGSIVVENQSERLKLHSRQSSEYDVWSLLHVPIPSVTKGASPYVTGNLAEVGKELAPQNVAKLNQQYVLCLQFEYIGASNQGKRILDRHLENFNARLPMGYSAKSDTGNRFWSREDNKQYALILLIIVIIYFMSSILFNSLRQPFAIIFVIPISYIGVFLTFYWFRLNFDQGVFAAFVLLCGITINSSIYILNEYNSIRRQKPLMPPARAYLKAWNAKIGPIFLTIVSSILGFIPFMAGLQREGFWFPLAAGSIGGLLMSFVGIFLYLPLFTLPKKLKVENESAQASFKEK